jgi:UrcA family protein
MTKGRIALLGSAMLSAIMMCGAGMAKAQDYGPYADRYYDDRTETVIVHPDYNDIEKRQVTGRVNGEINPTEYTLSRPVSFSDLDLTRDEDYLELRARVHDAARDMCFELDARVPELRGDESADRECVRQATHDAMRAVLDHRYG